MKKRRWLKVFGGVAGLFAVSLALLAIAISRDQPCSAAPPLAAGAETMQAISQRCYGSSQVLKLEQVAKPKPAADEVLIRVRAASINPLDKHYMYGTPYLLRLSAGFGAPDFTSAGVDVAGVVDAVGPGVTRFKVGDEVFGAVDGAFAQYATRRASGPLALKPARLSFEQAAAMPIAAVTALQALRDKAKVQPGQRVLINGASGGVGTFAVQIAKAMGAVVTGVSSTRNVDMVRSIGANWVIDYTQQDFTQGDQRYDVIIDMVANHSLSALLRVLEPEGALVTVGSVEMNPWWGPLNRPLKTKLLSFFVSQRLELLLASMDAADLDYLAGLAESGQLTPVIDRSHTLAEVPEAMRYLEAGRARGKVVIRIDP